MTLGERIERALTVRLAQTAPSAPDPRLRGRTYAVPFDRVWTSALALVGGRLRGWSLIEADDLEGVIRGEAVAPVLRRVSDVTVHVRLDADGQTRVDARSISRTERGDLGANVRLLTRFFEQLDRLLTPPKGAAPPAPTYPS